MVSNSDRYRRTLRVTAHQILTNVRRRINCWETRLREPGLAAFLIVETLLIFVVLPLEADGEIPGSIPIVMLGLFVLTSLFVALQSTMAIAVVVGSIVITQLISLLLKAHGSTLIDWCDVAARHAAICAVSWVIARGVLKPGRITIYRVEAAIALYINIGLFFFTTYRFMLSVAPESFSGVKSDPIRSSGELLYFSFARLVASGYREITPVGLLAQILVNGETLVGLLYPIIVLIWFIILYREQSDA